MHKRRSGRFRRTVSGLGTLLIVTGLLSTTLATALEPTDPTFFDLIPGTLAEDHVVGDDPSYPTGTGDVPAGCTADRDEILIGERYVSASAPTRWETDFRRVPMVYDDIVVIEWDSIAPGCETARVSLSSKASRSTQFDMNDDQWGINSVTCNGVGFPTCEEIGNRLVLPVSLQGVMKCFQVDAHLGRQLLSIGPSGNYYSFLNRNHNVLIGAKNGGVSPCDDTTKLREDFPVIATDPCPFAVPEDEIPEGSKQCRNVLTPDEPSTTTTTTMTPSTTSTTAPSNNTLEPPPTTEAPPVEPSPPTTICPEFPLAAGQSGGAGFAGPAVFSSSLMAALFRADDCPEPVAPPTTTAPPTTAPPTTAPPTIPRLEITTTVPMNNTLESPPTTATEIDSPTAPPTTPPASAVPPAPTTPPTTAELPPSVTLPRTGGQHDIAAEFGLSMMLIGAAMLLMGLSLRGNKNEAS